MLTFFTRSYTKYTSVTFYTSTHSITLILRDSTYLYMNAVKNMWMLWMLIYSARPFQITKKCASIHWPPPWCLQNFLQFFFKLHQTEGDFRTHPCEFNMTYPLGNILPTPSPLLPLSQEKVIPSYCCSNQYKKVNKLEIFQHVHISIQIWQKKNLIYP